MCGEAVVCEPCSKFPFNKFVSVRLLSLARDHVNFGEIVHDVAGVQSLQVTQ